MSVFIISLNMLVCITSPTMTVCHYAEYIVLICDNYPTMPICIISLNMLVCILYYLPDYVRHVSFPKDARMYIVSFARLYLYDMYHFPTIIVCILYYLPDFTCMTCIILLNVIVYYYSEYYVLCVIFPTMPVCIISPTMIVCIHCFSF